MDPSRIPYKNDPSGKNRGKHHTAVTERTGPAEHGSAFPHRRGSGKNFEQALEDLNGFDRIWVVFVLDRNNS